jgi:HAMP domain-containing protein
MSVFELRKIGDHISGALMRHVQSIDAAKRMLDKMHTYEILVMNQVSGKISEEQADYSTLDSTFSLYYAEVYKRASTPQLKVELDSIHTIYLHLKQIRKDMPSTTALDLRVKWYLDVFYPVYSNMLTRTRNLILDNQKQLTQKAGDIEVGYYRLVMPGMIATAVSIFALLMLGLFIHVYMVKPLLKINNGIQAFVNYKSPFQVDIATKDELKQLKESVEVLINKIKNNSNRMS